MLQMPHRKKIDKSPVERKLQLVKSEVTQKALRRQGYRWSRACLHTLREIPIWSCTFFRIMKMIRFIGIIGWPVWSRTSEGQNQQRKKSIHVYTPTPRRLRINVFVRTPAIMRYLYLQQFLLKILKNETAKSGRYESSYCRFIHYSQNRCNAIKWHNSHALTCNFLQKKDTSKKTSWIPT